MRNNILIILFVSIININAQENSQDTIHRFSLEEAINYSMENNTDIVNKKIDMVIAKKKVWETTAIGLPQLNASVSYQYTLDVPVMTMYNMGVVFPNPGDYLTHYHTLDTMELELGSESNTTIDFTLSQLIFSGEYIVGLQASKTYKEISQKAFLKTQKDVKESVSQTYYMVLILDQNLKILSSSKNNTAKILNEMYKMYKAGFVEETDYDQINLTNLTLNNTVRSLKRQFNLSRNLLKLQLGCSLKDSLVLTDSLESFIQNIDYDALALSEFNVGQNVDYQIIETQEALNRLSLRREQSTYLPTISAFYRHQEQLNAPEFNFSPPDVVGVSLSLPLFTSGMRNSKVQQARLELDKSTNTKEQVGKALTVQFIEAKNNFMTAYENFNNEKQNIKLSEKIYNNTLKKYKEGMSSSLELTQAHNQFLNIQSSYFKSLVELLNSKVTIEKLL